MSKANLRSHLLSQQVDLNQPALRRAPLLNSMNDLGAKEISCHGCSGPCCTFLKNSMQVTPLEAVDIYVYLYEQGLWNEELEKRLKGCITEFRLDKRPSTGSGQLMRKTYTCPFFLHQKLGCSLDPAIKPYGCLGFNPTEKGEIEGRSCRSNIDLLEFREEIDLNESQKSQKITEVLHLPWEKETIPQALLDVHFAWQHLCN
ncbi:MAG: hypothetical protein NXH75_07360 [Halobacteriovoraceae bacterium]|nr:hypothetical protein [Halobacteriovoraceae bacterium]